MVHGGTSYHLTTLADPNLAPYRLRPVYLPELDPGQLGALDTLIVCDRLHPGLLREHAGTLLQVAGRGGTLVVLGEVEAHTWLPGAAWTARPANFWWWLSGEDPGIRRESPDHPIWAYLTPKHVTWHFHGLLDPPAGATALVTHEEDGQRTGVVLYEDTVSTPGRLVVTTLDPTYHHGSNFMPSATRFLYGVLDWLTAPGAAA